MSDAIEKVQGGYVIRLKNKAGETYASTVYGELDTMSALAASLELAAVAGVSVTLHATMEGNGDPLPEAYAWGKVAELNEAAQLYGFESAEAAIKLVGTAIARGDITPALTWSESRLAQFMGRGAVTSPKRARRGRPTAPKASGDDAGAAPTPSDAVTAPVEP